LHNPKISEELTSWAYLFGGGLANFLRLGRGVISPVLGIPKPIIVLFVLPAAGRYRPLGAVTCAADEGDERYLFGSAIVSHGSAEASDVLLGIDCRTLKLG
jgi:hypothetical protein